MSESKTWNDKADTATAIGATLIGAVFGGTGQEALNKTSAPAWVKALTLPAVGLAGYVVGLARGGSMGPGLALGLAGGAVWRSSEPWRNRR